MKTALQGIPEVTREAPVDVAQINGEWIYKEYLNSQYVVNSLGLNDPPPTSNNHTTSEPLSEEEEKEKSWTCSSNSVLT